MATPSKQAKFNMIRERVKDLAQNNAEAIEKGLFVRITAKIIPEMQFLVAEVQRLSKEEADEPELEEATA